MATLQLLARGCALALLALAGLGSGSSAAQQLPRSPPYLSNFPGFAPDLTPGFPGDVDTALKQRLEEQRRLSEAQRLFDLYAWQMFLAVNWPTNDQGQPAPSLTDVAFGEPHWTLWQTSSQIYRVDGKRPAACDATAGSASPSGPTPIAQPPAPLLRGLPPPPQRPEGVRPRSARHLANLSAVGRISVLDLTAGDTSQAFSGPLIDQNGNFVHYEIVLDPNEVRYICETGIYNINGQLAFGKGKQNAALDFPSGTDAQDWSGATELKFAWKVIAGTDRADRFFTMTAHLPDARGGWREVTVGLVGMHISHKSQSSPQWIWATFEHVDNLVGDPLAHPPIRPSFYNPNCPLCVPNQDPAVTHDTTTPTQVVRAIQIPGDKMRLNAEAQAVLAKLGSVWQYYQLIDTQRPTDPLAKPTPWSAGLPGAIENKPGGKPTPVYLTNVTMETYFQTGVQAACHREELPSGVACPPRGPDSFPSALGTQVFATESCMGCHSSARLYRTYEAKDPRTKTFWPQLSAGFSWLPQLEAAYNPTPADAEGGVSQQAPSPLRLPRR